MMHLLNASAKRWIRRPRIGSLFNLRHDDLLRDAVFRRLWFSVFISSLGGQVTMLALPLSAALLLNASPKQMGWLTAMEVLPFLLFSLPGGVWLDRVRKLPVVVVGEVVLGLIVASVPLAWSLGLLSMAWLYGVGFALGTVFTLAGSAAQIVLTQVVPRERLVEAHARNALASSTTEVLGPAAAGLLIRAVGAPLALLVDACLVLISVVILIGVKSKEVLAPKANSHFWLDLREGLNFVRSNALLVSLAAAVSAWQFCHHIALVVQILFATRVLGLSEEALGLCFVASGVGTLLASMFGDAISRRLGPGPCLTLAFGVCATGWLVLAAAPQGLAGVLALVLMLGLFGFGAVLIFINFLALRQAVTPTPLLGRMTSTMRWLILIPAGPGALVGGWVGEHLGLRTSLALAGCLGLGLVALMARHPVIRGATRLPSPPNDDPIKPIV